MLRKILTPAIFMASLSSAFSQDSTDKKGELTLSGSADGYYRYNFANAKDQGGTNNDTSCSNSQNSCELGNAAVKADDTVDQVSAPIELVSVVMAREFFD